MTVDDVLMWLKKKGTRAARKDMLRYGIPNENAFGIGMGVMKKYAATPDRH